jgi:hypothetical protein
VTGGVSFRVPADPECYSETRNQVRFGNEEPHPLRRILTKKMENVIAKRTPDIRCQPEKLFAVCLDALVYFNAG